VPSASRLETGRAVAYVQFEDALQVTFAVQVLPRRRPDVLNDDLTCLAESYVRPDEALVEVAAPFCWAVLGAVA
jgi:hypothetical protein